MFSYYALSVLSIFLFLYGFFPFTKKHSSYILSPPEYLNEYKFNLSEVYKTDIERTVFIVIDALRYDFVTALNTPFLASGANNNGCLALVKVEPPTVTLPRIKALTTGSIPQFIDVIFNLISTETYEDSFLHRAVENHKKIVFYGDDTWLKIYPKLFMRSEGTTSFYVNDFTEVDDNVTRNAIKELANDDWDLMILHYLGLDHIGHIYGPFSSLVRPKLQEMDNIIRKLYETFIKDNKKTLILITGDHGMKDSGGHGGTTHSETTVPLIMLGKSCLNDSLLQTDIPATLSILLALSFPAENVGRVSSKLLSSYDQAKLLYALRYNVLALQSKTNICEDLIENATILHYEFIRGKQTLFNDIKNIYEFCANRMSAVLTKSSIQQDNYSMITSCVVILYCFLSILLENGNGRKNKLTSNLFVLLLLISAFMKYYLIQFVFILFMSVLLLHIFSMLTKLLLNIKMSSDIFALMVGCILHSLSMLSSSFIEEEHQILYFIFGTLLLIDALMKFKHFKKSSLHIIFTFAIFRFIKKLNQTGDKWAFLPDLAQWFSISEHYMYLHIFYILSLVLVWASCYSFIKLSSYLSCLTLLLIYLFKMFDLNCKFVWLIWCTICINIIICLKTSCLINSITISWILTSTLLLRPHNVILLSFCVQTSSIFFNQTKNKVTLTIVHLWLGAVLYFCQGHSNSLASIDVASGYIGLKNYKPCIVILQVICHTYCTPVLSLLLLTRRINNIYVWKILIACRLLVILSVFIVTFIQKHHLFVWSVFAPKLLIESGHSLILFIEMLIYYFVMYLEKPCIKIKINTW